MVWLQKAVRQIIDFGSCEHDFWPCQADPGKCFRNSETFSNDRPISGLGVYKDLAKYPSPVLLLYHMALEVSRMLSQTAVVLGSLLTVSWQQLLLLSQIFQIRGEILKSIVLPGY